MSDDIIIYIYNDTISNLLLPECTEPPLHGIQRSHFFPHSPAYHEPDGPMCPSNFDSY